MTNIARKWAGAAALGAAVSGLLYSISFFAVGTRLAGLFLVTGGVLSTAVFAALYRELRDDGPYLSIWAVLLGTGAMLASVAHGGYDLASGFNSTGGVDTSIASPVDPRGLMTFGVAGIAVIAFSILLRRSSTFSSELGYLGFALAFFMEVLYAGTLMALGTHNPVIILSAVMAGFVLNPLWYGWLAIHWLRARVRRD